MTYYVSEIQMLCKIGLFFFCLGKNSLLNFKILNFKLSMKYICESLESIVMLFATVF